MDGSSGHSVDDRLPGKLGYLVAAIVGTWAIVVAGCLGLWYVLCDPATWPAAGRTLPKWLTFLSSVPYSDPDLVARVRVSRVAVLATMAFLTALGWLHRGRIGAAVRRFFTTPSHPLNLGVFRVVVFYQVYQLCYFDFIARIVRLPDALQFPPATGLPAIGPLAALATWPPQPFTPAQVEVAGVVLRAACVTAMLGIFSRTSALMVAVLMTAAWGAAQWYGKVDHLHHVVWFALVLAVSPCGDSLSVDALLRGWRRGCRGDTEPERVGLAYGLPLRICMVLLGVLYVFPGFWKLWRSGFDWFLSQNPYNQMYLKWHMIGGWKPSLRIDAWPLLMHGGALATILFELAFVFLLFGRRTVYLAAVAGVGVHTALDVLMRHGFESLRAAYVMFVDWDALARWIGRRLFRGELMFSFDPRDAGVGATVAVARRLDWMGAVVWVDRSAADGAGVASRSTVEAWRAGAVYSGARAWVALATRVPPLWPLLPVLALGSAAAGAQRKQDSWPLACYPLFDGILADFYDTLQIVVVGGDGRERVIVADDYRHTFGNMWNNLLRRIVNERDERRRAQLLRVVSDVLEREGAGVAAAWHLRFYTVRSWIAPERWGDAPDNPRLMFENHV